MSWASELPPELLCRPMGLIALTGLDVTYNAIHKLIWDSFFNNRRPDRVPLKFLVCQGDHEYPKCRSKQRTSYEWYVPKGILKTSWMGKHLQLVPAVVAVFFDLDWDETMWKERQMECATRVEIVRNSLSGRGSKVAVVLVQKNAPLPPGEDMVAAERAASLCSACDLSAKALYVLPHTDHLIGYTIRLENAFYELAQGYYHTEARKVRAHKDFLNKTTHQLLFIRHQFKIGFFSELKQDTHTALKHYKQAYGHILDHRMHDTNVLEVKTFAGFVNYKICRLSFHHNAPLDAIAQFRKHIDYFKSKTGIADLSFEHSAWMSKQFHVFGDLFDEAIKLGLTAIQTQHPGFYYQQAANHAISRKQLCRGLCKASSHQPTPNPLEHLQKLDYYGQRAWRQGHQSIEPPDLLRERDGILALQNLELREDHSWIIIPLLSSAVAQFKKYKAPRMKRFLMVQMGEEYFHAKDYNKALMLLNKVLWDYRSERWWPLLTSILETSLKCSYLTSKVQEYVTNCLELMGSCIPDNLVTRCAEEEKTRIQMNLIRVLTISAPEPEPGLDPACVEKCKALWDANSEGQCIFTVEMQNIVSFVECKARFTSERFSAACEVVLEVYLRVDCPFPVRFSKLSVLMNNQIYNQHCMVSDGHGISASSMTDSDSGGDLYFITGKPKVYVFKFLPVKADVGNQIEMSSIALEFGSISARCAILRWGGGGGNLFSLQQQDFESKQSELKNTEQLDWDAIKIRSSTRIIERESLLGLVVSDDAPCLLNEFYPVSVKIDNKEMETVTNVSLSVGLTDEAGRHLEQTTHVSMDKATYNGAVTPRLAGVDLGSMSPGQKINKQFYVKCIETGFRDLKIKVTYSITVQNGQTTLSCTCRKEAVVMMTVVTPFDMQMRLASMKFEDVDCIHADESFLLMSEIQCTSPWPIEIQHSAMRLSQFIRNSDEVFKSQLESVSMKKNERAAECICLLAPLCMQPSVSLGVYSIHWRRKNLTLDIPYVTTSATMPTATVEHIPLSASLKLPAFGNIKTLLPLNYILHNKTAYTQEVEASMDTSDSFMFSGNKQIHFRILPNNTYTLSYNLFPLIPGHVMLPRLHVNMLRYPGTIDDILQKMLPSHVFIKPSGKALNMPA